MLNEKQPRPQKAIGVLTLVAALAATVPAAEASSSPEQPNQTVQVSKTQTVSKGQLRAKLKELGANGIRIDGDIMYLTHRKIIGAGNFSNFTDKLTVKFKATELKILADIQALLGEGVPLTSPGGRFYHLT